MTDLEEAGFWLEQAAVDLQVAEELQEKFPAAACFHAQQAAQKAVKSICYAGGIGGNATRAHYLNDLYRLLEGLAPLRALLPPLEEVSALDAFYVPTRYPDAWDRARRPRCTPRSRRRRLFTWLACSWPRWPSS